jgi:hypothetical protein
VSTRQRLWPIRRREGASHHKRSGKIKKVDALEKEITGQWMNTIRATVAAEAVAATAVVVAGKAAIASGVARAHLAIINNPASAWAAGFSAGLAKGALVSGSTNAPKPILPSRAMTSGYMWGEAAGLLVKDYMRYFGGH